MSLEDLAEILYYALKPLYQYLKRRNDQEPVTAGTASWYAKVISQVNPTEQDVKEAAIYVAMHEEWFPTPSAFVAAIERARIQRGTSFIGEYILDPKGNQWVHKKGDPLPTGWRVVPPALPSSSHGRELNANNPQISC